MVGRGPGPGLGQGIAVALARAGADLVICDIDPASLAAAREAVLAEGRRCLAIVCDVSSSQQVADMFAQACETFGTVHILVNNAALTPNRPVDTERRNRLYAYMQTPVARGSLGFTSEISDEEWLRYWGVNVHGTFYCTRAALRLMQPQHYGRIVNIASIAGISSKSAHSPHYSATKGAVVAFTRSVALEVAGANIYVNAMAPGGVATPAFNEYLERIGEHGRNRLWQGCPACRFGTVDTKLAALIRLNIDVTATHLYKPGVSRHVREAIRLGATRAEILEVFKLASVVGIHACAVGVPALAEELARAGIPDEPMAPGATPVCDAVRANGMFYPLWETLYRWDPQYLEKLLAMGFGLWQDNILPPLWIEFLCVAGDAAVTHMYGHATQRHIEAALRLGATRAQILAALLSPIVVGGIKTRTGDLYFAFDLLAALLAVGAAALLLALPARLLTHSRQSREGGREAKANAGQEA